MGALTFYERFELLELVRDDGIKTFAAGERATGRAVLVHLFVNAHAPESRALLAKVDRLPEAERQRIVDRGENNGTPYVVTGTLDGYAGFREWLVAKATHPAPTPPSPAMPPPMPLPTPPPPVPPPMPPPPMSPSPAPPMTPPPLPQELAASSAALDELFNSLFEPAESPPPPPVIAAEPPVRPSSGEDTVKLPAQALKPAPPAPPAPEDTVKLPAHRRGNSGGEAG